MTNFITTDRQYSAFTVTGRQLSNAVAWATRSVTGAGSNVTDHSVEVEVADGKCTLSSCDFEASHSAVLADDVAGRIQLRIPAAVLSGYTKYCQAADDIEIVVHPAGFRLEQRQWGFDIPAFGSDQPLPKFDATTVGTCDARELADMIRQVGLCATRDVTLPALCGVQFAFGGEYIQTVATDRYRAARSQIAWEPASDSASEAMLVPVATLLDVRGTFRRAPQGSRADILIDSAHSVFGVACRGYRFAPRCLDGAPDLSRAFTRDGTAMRCLVDRRQLLGAVKRIAQRGHDRVYFKASGGHLMVRQDFEDASEMAIPATVVNLNTEGIWLTIRYLTSLLELLPGDNVTITTSQPHRPVQLSDGNGALFALQPARG